MKFELVSEASFDLLNVSQMVNQLSSELKKLFDDRDYGSEVESIIIGIITVNPSFDDFMTKKKPKYSRGRKSIVDHGVEIDVSNSLRFDIKLDFKKVIEISDISDLKHLFYVELKNNLGVFQEFKTTNFDLEKFKRDLSMFFEHN